MCHCSRRTFWPWTLYTCDAWFRSCELYKCCVLTCCFYVFLLQRRWSTPTNFFINFNLIFVENCNILLQVESYWSWEESVSTKKWSISCTTWRWSCRSRQWQCRKRSWRKRKPKRNGKKTTTRITTRWSTSCRTIWEVVTNGCLRSTLNI